MIVIPPALEERDELHYVALARTVTMDELGDAIPAGHMAVEAWFASRGIEPSGPPLIRYRVIDMERALHIELGWPVAQPVDAGPEWVTDSLPAGTYGVATYRNPDEGVEGNGALIDWARDNGIEWDRWDTADGDAFRSRVEFELYDPATQPDRTKWETEVAILVA